MSDDSNPSLAPVERTQDVARITAALRQAIQEALLSHKQAGNAVAIWQDNRVIWVPAEEIPVASRVAEDAPSPTEPDNTG